MRSQEVRALLVARKQLLGRLIDVELSIRGILRGFGLKVGPVTRKGFEARIRELVTGQVTLERMASAMLSARAALKLEYEKLHKAVLSIVRDDAVCRRLMTVPGVGPLVAVTYKSAMDDPNRIMKSKAAGALFGLTPRKYQSGEKDITGGITRAGDEMVRSNVTWPVTNSRIRASNPTATARSEQGPLRHLDNRSLKRDFNQFLVNGKDMLRGLFVEFEQTPDWKRVKEIAVKDMRRRDHGM